MNDALGVSTVHSEHSSHSGGSRNGGRASRGPPQEDADLVPRAWGGGRPGENDHRHAETLAKKHC